MHSFRTHLAAAALAFATAVAVGAEHTSDSLDTVRQRLKLERAMLVDVREKAEWDKGHIADAVLVPLSSLRNYGDPTELAKQLPKDQILYTYCAVGQRALLAAEMLRKHGYDVRPLKQGYKELIKSGFPTAPLE